MSSEIATKRVRRRTTPSTTTATPTVKTTTVVDGKRLGIVLVNQALLKDSFNRDPKIVILDLEDYSLLYHPVRNESDTKVSSLIQGSEVSFNRTVAYDEERTICDVQATQNKIELPKFNHFKEYKTWPFTKYTAEKMYADENGKSLSVVGIFYSPKDKEKNNPIFIIE